MAQIVFPSQFSAVLQGQLHQVADGNTVADVLKNICSQNASLKKLLFLGTGNVTPFLVFTVAGEDRIYSASQAASLQVKPEQTIEVLVGMAGG